MSLPSSYIITKFCTLVQMDNIHSYSKFEKYILTLMRVCNDCGTTIIQMHKMQTSHFPQKTLLMAYMLKVPRLRNLYIFSCFSLAHQLKTIIKYILKSPEAFKNIYSDKTRTYFDLLLNCCSTTCNVFFTSKLLIRCSILSIWPPNRVVLHISSKKKN